MAGAAHPGHAGATQRPPTSDRHTTSIAPPPAKATDDGSEPATAPRPSGPTRPLAVVYSADASAPEDSRESTITAPGASATAAGLPATATTPKGAAAVHTAVLTLSAPCQSPPPLFQKTSMTPADALTDGSAASAVGVSCWAPLQPHEAPVSCQRSPDAASRQNTVSEPASELTATGVPVAAWVP